MSQRIHEYLQQRKIAKDLDSRSTKSDTGEQESTSYFFDKLKNELRRPDKFKEQPIDSSNEPVLHSIDSNIFHSEKSSDENIFKDLSDENENTTLYTTGTNNSLANNPQSTENDGTFDYETDPNICQSDMMNNRNNFNSSFSPDITITRDSFTSLRRRSLGPTSTFLTPQVKLALLPIGVLTVNYMLSNLFNQEFLLGLILGLIASTAFFMFYQRYFQEKDIVSFGDYDRDVKNHSCCTRHNEDYVGWWPHYAPCSSKYPTLVSWNDLPRPNIPETQRIPIIPPEMTTQLVNNLTSNLLPECLSETQPVNSKEASNIQTSNIQNNTCKSYTSTLQPPLTTSNVHINYLNKIESCSYLANGLAPIITPNGKVHYRGWMNLVNTYNPYTHRLNMTRSVYVVLEETTLKIYRPKRNIPRRAMWNEAPQPLQPNLSSFVNQYTIDMKLSKVALHPVGIVKRRYWSKKYPIYISAKQVKTTLSSSFKPVKSTNSEVIKKANSSTSQSTTLPAINSSTNTPASQTNIADDLIKDIFSATQKTIPSANIYLFSRTDREKESWYRRLYAASIGKPLQITPSIAIRNFIMKNDGQSSATIPSSDLHQSSSQAVLANDKKDRTTTASYSVRNESISLSGSSTNTLQSNGPATANNVNGPMSTVGSPSQSVNNRGESNNKEEPIYVEYIRYMAKCMPADWLLKSSFAIQLNIRNIFCDDQMAWLNALIGRIFWDFFREDHWLEKVKQRIQNKLNKIKVPPFIDPLTVVSVELGNDIPVIRKAAKPFVDTHGVWFELEFVYAGSFALMLETKINLMKSKEMRKDMNNQDEDELCDETKNNFNKSNRMKMKKAVFLSDEEDSAETTTDSDNANDFDLDPINVSQQESDLSGKATPDVKTSEQEEEEENTPHSNDAVTQKQTKKALYRLVDKFAKSTLVQNKVILKGIDYMSKTSLKMRVDVFQLSGTVVLNLPPPPSDRLWFGFRACPQLKLKAKPQIGVMNISVSKILEWIENKLMHEFERVAVLPNMLDFRVPLLVSDQIDSGPSPLAT